MTTVELVCRCVLHLLLAACAAMLCVRLCTGCAYVKAMHEDAKPAVVVLLKEAYANGGAAAVSNRIEKLVASGDLSPEQAARLHVIGQGVYDRVVDRLEAETAAE